MLRMPPTPWGGVPHGDTVLFFSACAISRFEISTEKTEVFQDLFKSKDASDTVFQLDI